MRQGLRMNTNQPPAKLAEKRSTISWILGNFENTRSNGFFLSPRRRSGERTEGRGILTHFTSSPRPSPPFDGGEGVSLLADEMGNIHSWFSFRGCSLFPPSSHVFEFAIIRIP